MTATFARSIPKFGRDNVKLVDIRPENDEATVVSIDGRIFDTSDRFWNSIFSMFGFGKSIFKYYKHNEVFERISAVEGDVVVHCTWEEPEDSDLGTPKMLATSTFGKPIITSDSLIDIVNKFDIEGLVYSDGIITSTHNPVIPVAREISGDMFSNQFVLDCPIDGYGKPAFYLSLLRAVCSNGAVAYTKAFKTETNIGSKKVDHDNIDYVLTKALESFNNEDGFIALRQRWESASKSWASINEVNVAYKTIVRVHGSGLMKNGKNTDPSHRENSHIFKSFHSMCDQLQDSLGLANLNSLSVKKQRHLPAGVKLYDLLNFMTETATHHCDPTGSKIINAFVGATVSDTGGYDLEGTLEQFPNWKDFLIKDEKAIDAITELQ